MRLTSVRIKNFKNLVDVAFDELGPVNVLHGPNNVGKSNVLQAIAVLFRCLRPKEGQLPFARSRPLLPAELAGLDLQPLDIFCLETPREVSLGARIAIPRAELEQAGIAEVYPCEPLEVEVTLSKAEANVDLRITRFKFSDGTDAARRQSTEEEKTRCLRFALFLAANALVREGPADRFALIGVQRRVEGDKIHRQGGLVSLAEEMFDSKESLDTLRAQRWKAFGQAMHRFERATGPGEFLATFQRQEGQARLVFDSSPSGTRIALSLMGTGVQQLVSLLGHVMMSNASIVAIEEPELNLRRDLQETLSTVLMEVATEVVSGRGPSQFFLCSHSPAFETEHGFYLMEPGEKGPTISLRPPADATSVVGGAVRPVALPADAPLSYLTSQGVVKVPDHIRAHLKLAAGGGVFFLKGDEDEQALLMSEGSYFRKVEGE